MLMHLYSKESILSPVCSPWVSSNPVFLSRLFIDSPSNNGNIMIHLWENLNLRENSTRIILKFISHWNSASNRSSSKYFSFHFLRSFHSAILRSSPSCEVLHSPACTSINGHVVRSWSSTIHTKLFSYFEKSKIDKSY